MTTIAFDGTYLAVDRAGWKGSGYVPYEVGKLFAVPAANPVLGRAPYGCEFAYYAGAGSEGDCSAIARWLGGHGDRPEIVERDQAKGLLVCDGKLYHVHGGLQATLVHTVPWADGGGGDMALGCMVAGKTAPQALELVAKHSTWAAIGMDYVNVRTGQMVRTMFR